MHEWIVGEKLPRFEDRFHFDVWIGGGVREVRRTGNRETYFSPGLLVYTDCWHPMQNVLCDERAVQGWRLREDRPVFPSKLSGALDSLIGAQSPQSQHTEQEWQQFG